MARKPLISAAMLDLMARREHHAWTLEDLQAGLAGRGAAANFSTVFRAAEKLAADGAVLKLLLDDGRARFELADAHHDHLHCTECDELVPVPCVIAGAQATALEAETGVAIRGHRIIFRGLCSECREGRP
ncbi:MAG TPA: transcriptional repressor [Stellaceae bacterium]|jgi:Fur family ferric uptake transcriptional regulator|nr:transcriptional repressor [Stellaceae bacterium]